MVRLPAGKLASCGFGGLGATPSEEIAGGFVKIYVESFESNLRYAAKIHQTILWWKYRDAFPDCPSSGTAHIDDVRLSSPSCWFSCLMEGGYIGRCCVTREDSLIGKIRSSHRRVGFVIQYRSPKALRG